MDENLSQIKQDINHSIKEPAIKTYSAVVANNATKEEIKQAIKEQKEEENIVKSKSCNLTVHGVVEYKNETDEQTAEIDRNYIVGIDTRYELNNKEFQSRKNWKTQR